MKKNIRIKKLENNGCQIALEASWTRVRSGGAGYGAWIARLTGLDEVYGFERKFCRRDESGLSNSGNSGMVQFQVNEPGIYEFRDFCIGTSPRTGLWSGFVQIFPEGELIELTKKECIKLLGESSPEIVEKRKRKIKAEKAKNPHKRGEAK